MQKANATFNVEAGRILPDLSKGKKVNTETETKAKTRGENGARVSMLFVNAKGEEFKSPPQDVIGIAGCAVETDTRDFLDLRALCDEDGRPKPILFQLAAFGASTLGRNEVGTTPKDEPETAAENFLSRWNGFKAGTYRSLSTGSATPLIILAMVRAFQEAGKTEEYIAAKKAEYLAAMDEGEDEAAQKKARALVSKKLRGITPIRQAEEAIRAERAAARIAVAKSGSLDDL